MYLFALIGTVSSLCPMMAGSCGVAMEFIGLAIIAGLLVAIAISLSIPFVLVYSKC